MSDYAFPLWPFLAIGMLGGVAFLVWMSIPAARARYTRGVAREQGLELNDEIAPLVTRYYVRRLRLTALSMVAVLGLTALLAVVGVGLPFEGTTVWMAGMMAIIPLITLGGGIGTLASALLWPHSISGSTVTGRLTPPSRHDMVAPWEERVLLGAVALGAVTPVLVVALGLGAGRPETIVALVMGALAGLALIGWRAAADRVLQRRPIAGDAQALLWSDALRSNAVRFGMPVPAALAMTAMMLALGSAAFSIEEAGLRFGGLFMSFGIFVLALGLLGVTISQLARSASRRWQRSLWPELARAATA